MMKYNRFVSKDKKSTLTVTGERLKLKEPWSNCQRQLCSCSRPDVPVFRYQCENGKGCKKFERMDFGCYRLGVGKAPVELTECKCQEVEE